MFKNWEDEDYDDSSDFEKNYIEYTPPPPPVKKSIFFKSTPAPWCGVNFTSNKSLVEIQKEVETETEIDEKLKLSKINKDKVKKIVYGGSTSSFLKKSKKTEIKPRKSFSVNIEVPEDCKQDLKNMVESSCETWSLEEPKDNEQKDENEEQLEDDNEDEEIYQEIYNNYNKNIEKISTVASNPVEIVKEEKIFRITELKDRPKNVSKINTELKEQRKSSNKMGDKKCTKFCEFWLKQGKCQRVSCNFAHCVEEYTPLVCKFKLNCKYYDTCPYKHENESIQDLLKRLKIKLPAQSCVLSDSRGPEGEKGCERGNEKGGDERSGPKRNTTVRGKRESISKLVQDKANEGYKKITVIIE